MIASVMVVAFYLVLFLNNGHEDGRIVMLRWNELCSTWFHFICDSESRQCKSAITSK
jgi:hypothetical protein